MTRSSRKAAPDSPVTAVLIGSFVVIPGLLSVYNYGQRIKRAQGVAGVPSEDRINPVLAFLLVFPFGVLVIPGARPLLVRDQAPEHRRARRGALNSRAHHSGPAKRGENPAARSDFVNP